jgi:CRP/FNR family transcriptional regulator, nitrogen oxide reductase regulator
MIHVVDLSSVAFFPQACTDSFTRTEFDKRVERLRNSALFAGLSSQACSEALQYAKSKTFLRSEVLFSQGQTIDRWILVQSGRVKLTQVTSNGNEVILWLIGCGDAVGVHAGGFGYIESCAACAMEKCDTLVWERRDIQLILARHPQIKTNLEGILTARLYELEERFCEIATESVAGRLAFLLRRLCKSIGKQSKLGIELRLRRQELAQMTGTTLFTVSRVLSRWADSGLVDPHRDGITVRHPDHLIDISYQKKRASLLCHHA